MNELKLHKGMKLYWCGSHPSEPYYYDFPAGKVEILSVDNKKKLALIGCQIHFKPETEFKHPQYRERWVNFDELSKEPFDNSAQKVPCQRCGHQWIPRTERPAVCPHCKSARWDTPKGDNEPGPKPKKKEL